MVVFTAIIREDGGVAGGEVEGTGDGATKEDGCAGRAAVEVEPFFGLGGTLSDIVL